MNLKQYCEEAKNKPLVMLPCPFCGGVDIETIYDDGWETGCTNCSTYVAPFLGGAADDKKKSIEFWNTRAERREG